jgi:hypothetical protein
VCVSLSLLEMLLSGILNRKSRNPCLFGPNVCLGFDLGLCCLFLLDLWLFSHTFT